LIGVVGDAVPGWMFFLMQLSGSFLSSDRVRES
jgi:hypothetical protein